MATQRRTAGRSCQCTAGGCFPAEPAGKQRTDLGEIDGWKGGIGVSVVHPASIRRFQQL
jgi:hypothetical protein